MIEKETRDQIYQSRVRVWTIAEMREDDKDSGGWTRVLDRGEENKDSVGGGGDDSGKVVEAKTATSLATIHSGCLPLIIKKNIG